MQQCFRCPLPECPHGFLEIGADSDGVGLGGYAALRACGIWGKGVDYIFPLGRAGAQVDAVYESETVHCHGVTALGFASLVLTVGVSRSL